MNKNKGFIKRTLLMLVIGGVVPVIFSYVMIASAAYPATPYNPGAVLDPLCAPGDTNCTVYSPVPLINNYATISGVATSTITGDGTGSTIGGGLTMGNATATSLYLTNALGILYGGTGTTTANGAFNALAPSQTSNSGKFLTTDGTDTSWATIAATTPGGSDTYIQFNNSGAFGGASDFTWASSTKILTIGGSSTTTISGDGTGSTIGGSATIGSTSILGSEVFTNPNLTGGTSWSAVPDMSLTGNAAVYGGVNVSGGLTQSSANFATPVVGGSWYRFDYVVSNLLTWSGTVTIPSTFADAQQTLSMTEGSHTAYFKTAVSPGNFVINVTANFINSGFTIDSFSLKKAGGDLTVVGDIISGTDGRAGRLSLYSEQGGTDYSVGLSPSGLMTQSYSLSLPTALPSSAGLLKSTTAGVMSWDTTTYLTAEADDLATVTSRGNSTTDNLTADYYISTAGAWVSGVADGASAIAHTLTNFSTFSTAGAKLLSLQNNGSEKVYVDKDGQLFIASGTSTAITATTTLSHASNNEVAYQLNYTTNKAAGNDTGLEINMTDTASPGTSNLLDLKVGGTSKFSVSDAGIVRASSAIFYVANDSTPLTVMAYSAADTSDLQDWKDGYGNIVSSVSSDGYIHAGRPSVLAPGAANIPLTAKAMSGQADTTFYVEAPDNTNHCFISMDGTNGKFACDGDTWISGSTSVTFKTYASVGGIPSYSNSGGIGDRTLIITASTTMTLHTYPAASYFVDGQTTYGPWWDAEAVSGKYVRFDFGVDASKLITEATWYQQSTQSQGTWKWQGSNNSTDWTDIGNTFTLGGATTQTITTLSGNITGYRYYQILGVSGNSSDNPYNYEMEFKIDNAPTMAYQTRMKIDNGGSVGVGTISPMNKLSIVNAGQLGFESAVVGTDDVGLIRSSTGVLKITDGSTGSGNLLFGGIATSTATAGDTATAFTLDTSNSFATGTQKLLSIKNYGTEKLYVDKDGQLFIPSGTSTAITATTTLSHASDNEVAYKLNYTTNKAAGNDTGLEINMTDTASPGTSYLINAQVGGVSKFSVDNTGIIVAANQINAGNGTGIFKGDYLYPSTASGGRTLLLHIGGAAFSSADNAIEMNTGTFSNTSGSSNMLAILPIYNQTSGTAANTDLLINRTQTAIGSGAQYLIDAQVGGVSKFSVTNTGAVLATTSMAIATTTSGVYVLYANGDVCLDLNADGTCTDGTATISDERFKTNIVSLDGGLDKVMALRGVSFNWNGDVYPDRYLGNGASIGFLAQEVESIVPEVVTANKEGFKYLDYGKLTAVLTKAVQEQQEEIELLKLSVADLSTSTASVSSGPAFDFSWVLDGLRGLGMTIEQGVVSVQKLVASFIQTLGIEIGSSEQPSGITTYDKTTKLPYCVYVDNGEMTKAQGKCEDVMSQSGGDGSGGGDEDGSGDDGNATTTDTGGGGDDDGDGADGDDTSTTTDTGGGDIIDGDDDTATTTDDGGGDGGGNEDGPSAGPGQDTSTTTDTIGDDGNATIIDGGNGN